MYKIFKEERKQIPYDQIKELYKGKWVYLVNFQGPYLFPNEDGEMEACDPISGEVFVEADEPYEGSETGIYKEVSSNAEMYGWTGEMDLRIGYPQNTNQIVIKEGTLLEND